MKKFLQTLSLTGLCLAVLAVSASAMVQDYGYYNDGSGYQGYNPGSTGGGYGCGAVAPVQYPNPRTTEYCTRWIAGHWVQVRVMMPGRWVNRPVWIPSYPMAQNKWVPGFWQTTGTNVRPDLQIWGSPNTGWYGQPYQGQSQNQPGGGYFDQNGVWISR